MRRLIDVFMEQANMPSMSDLVRTTATYVPTVFLNKLTFRNEFEIIAASVYVEINPGTHLETNLLVKTLHQKSMLQTSEAQMQAYTIIACRLFLKDIPLHQKLLQNAHALTYRPVIAFKAPVVVLGTDIAIFLADKAAYAGILKYRFEAGAVPTNLTNEWSYVTYVLAMSRLFLKQEYDIPKGVQYTTPFEICAAAQIFGIDGLYGHMNQMLYHELVQKRASIAQRPMPWLIHMSDIGIDDDPCKFFEYKERLPSQTPMTIHRGIAS